MSPNKDSQKISTQKLDINQTGLTKHEIETQQLGLKQISGYNISQGYRNEISLNKAENEDIRLTQGTLNYEPSTPKLVTNSALCSSSLCVTAGNVLVT